MTMPRHWRLQKERYRLIGAECEGCGAKLFPARQVCPKCKSKDLEPYQFSGKGEIYSCATVYQAPDGFEQFVPYMVALIRLDEGPIIAAQLTDAEKEGVAIGQRVEMVTRKIREYGQNGLILYGYKFRPVMMPLPK
jgi:uncharacterized OB-fold protein